MCEQGVEYVAQHKKSMRYMKKPCSNFMLAFLCKLDHKARKRRVTVASSVLQHH